MGSNRYEKVILPEAESDIIEILDYIHDELKNPTAAKKLYQNILEAIDRASLFPYAMPKLKNEVITAGKEYRRLDVENYVLIYKVVEELKQIRIMAVFYGPSNVVSRFLDRI